VNLNTQASPQAWIDGLDPEVPAGAFLTDNLKFQRIPNGKDYISQVGFRSGKTAQKRMIASISVTRPLNRIPPSGRSGSVYTT